MDNININNEVYDYKEAIKDDIYSYIEENREYIVEWIEGQGYISYDTLRNELYDNMFVSDIVTGNGSGSYTFSTWTAECCLCHNMDLLAEAMEELICDINILKNAEACDVAIRCYLLGQYLDEVMEIYREEWEQLMENNGNEEDE